MKLTIGMISLTERHEGTSRMMRALNAQTKGRDDVELLILVDNYATSTGEKRNRLIDLAKGDFLAMVDDDDMLSPDYVPEIMAAIDRDPETDVIVFNSDMFVRGKLFATTRWGLEYDAKDEIESKTLYRPACHFCCWRREFIKDVRFSDDYRGSDAVWINRLTQKIHDHDLAVKQQRIDQSLYSYMVNPRNETCKNAQIKYRGGLRDDVSVEDPPWAKELT